MKVPPNLSCNLGPSVLAIKSVEPPGGKGTTMVTGLSGQANAAEIESDDNKATTTFFITAPSIEKTY
jgi:hypothetical protein